MIVESDVVARQYPIRVGRMHRQDCASAFAMWTADWNVNPVPHPKLERKYNVASNRCGCQGDHW